MTWSCWIDADKANAPGFEIERRSPPYRAFRVKIRPDGVSDWIAHLLGEKSPVAGDVLVSTQSCGGLTGVTGIRADAVDWGYVHQFRVHGTPGPAETAEPPKGRYMVSIDGRGAPTQEHDTVESAIAEAQRAGAQPTNVSLTVRVLQVVATLPPVGERQVVMAGEAA